MTSVPDVEKFFNLSLDLLCIAGLDGHFRRVNPAFERLLGWTIEEILARPFFDFVHPEDVPTTHGNLERLAVQGDTVTFETRYRCADGRYRHLQWTATPEPVSGQFYAVARDITTIKAGEARLLMQSRELEAANQRLSQLASTDDLTELKNRRAFHEQLNMQLHLAQRGGREISLVLLDVDHFKEFNDSFGHLAGDHVLRTVSQLLTEKARTSDLVARYGGEEFAIVLPDTGRGGACAAAERYRMAIESGHWPQRPVTASVGAATLGETDTSQKLNVSDWENRLIDQADRALYSSKQAGRNLVTHADEL